MLISNYKVFVTKNGDGAITYTRNDVNYRVYISKENKLLFNIFNKYFKRLVLFKDRHYALAQYIARDIRKNGYYFKSYANNHTHIRPVPKTKIKSLTNEQILENLYRRKVGHVFTDLDRLLH